MSDVMIEDDAGSFTNVDGGCMILYKYFQSFMHTLDWWIMVFNATSLSYFSYIVAVRFIGGGKQSTRRKPPTCRKWLTNIDHIMLYRVHLALVGFKLIMLVVKGTDLHTLENWSCWFGLICRYTYEIQTYTLKSTILTCHQLSRSKFPKKKHVVYM